jgi:hypothetical protein
VLELTDNEEGIPKCYQRRTRNREWFRAVYKNVALTDSDCDEYIEDAMEPQLAKLAEIFIVHEATKKRAASSNGAQSNKKKYIMMMRLTKMSLTKIWMTKIMIRLTNKYEKDKDKPVEDIKDEAEPDKDMNDKDNDKTDNNEKDKDKPDKDITYRWNSLVRSPVM